AAGGDQGARGDPRADARGAGARRDQPAASPARAVGSAPERAAGDDRSGAFGLDGRARLLQALVAGRRVLLVTGRDEVRRAEMASRREPRLGLPPAERRAGDRDVAEEPAAPAQPARPALA